MRNQAKHNKILRLARGRATRFALSEYQRLELAAVRHDEDIMALHGRLYKDLFLSQSGKTAEESARTSAEKYEAAFKETSGFYSGINAATMSLVAGVPEQMVQMRAKRIIDLLPPTEALGREEKYFVEATRAEAYLLMGEEISAQRTLQTAIDHDPLNFIAHASTLKQFQMIGAYQDQNLDWLAAFRPPKTAHFSGHMFRIEAEGKTTLPGLSNDQVQTLIVNISELIQIEDIGFGYGALAAGADILFAEIILESGGELHVNLPVKPDIFLKASVEPFGKSWIPRFEACLDNAKSVSIAAPNSIQSNSELEKQASFLSMGAAIRKAESLSVQSVQLLIWDGQDGVTGTSADAKTWTKTEKEQHIIRYEGRRKKGLSIKSDRQSKPMFTLQSSSYPEIRDLEDLPLAISKALQMRTGANLDVKQVLSIQDMDSADQTSQLLGYPMPGSIMLSESVANYVTLFHSDAFAAVFLATSEGGNKIYVLHEKGTMAI